MKLKSFGCLLLAAVFTFSWSFLAVNSASAESLWGRHSIFTDRKASQVGDILTIVIKETSKTSQSLSNSNSKSGKNTLAAGTGIFGFLAAATASGSDSFKADGSANNSNTATGNVTVTVVEVKENGNMVVEGTQSIWNNKNEHRIAVRGVVRPDDIDYDNTISSNKVADATLKFDGKGPLNAKQRQGILTQIFNILF
ncbi:MAG: flagellar basal body L-ring protein FlgH [Anaerovibrio sp.]|nr:flagellar basal body L-ring protein FlgH [Anaerovibrio sp.]